MVGYWKLWTVNVSQRNSKRHRVSQMLLLTWVFIQPLFPPYKWLWCFEHSSVRFLIGFCFETSFKKTSPYSNLKPQQARIPSSRNKPLQEQLLPLSIVHNQQQLRQDLKRKWRYINTIRIKHHGHKNHWYHRQLSTPISKTSAIANELQSGPSAITTQHQYTLRQKSFLDKPTENQTLLSLKSDTNANSSTPN